MVTAVAALGVAAAVDWHNDVDVRPLIAQAVRDAASSGDTIHPLPLRTSNRWDSGMVPTWFQAQQLTGSGNHLLEDAFTAATRASADRGGGPSSFDTSSLDCLYWPVVERAGDRPADANYLTRVCYRATGPKSRPYGLSTTATTWD